MKVVAILQARTGSTRLPGKVLFKINGQPVVRRIIERLSLSQSVNEIVLATTEKAEDRVLCDIAEDIGVGWYRGSENDVLSRYVGAAHDARADVIVRVTADCPLIMPAVVDRVVSALRGGVDFSSNAVRRTHPRGLDTEAMYIDVLDRVARMAHSPAEREHVCTFVYQTKPELFVIHNVGEKDDQSHRSWALDTAEDYAHICDLVKRCNGKDLDYRTVLAQDYPRHPGVA